jgi:hypothetical protein
LGGSAFSRGCDTEEKKFLTSGPSVNEFKKSRIDGPFRVFVLCMPYENMTHLLELRFDAPLLMFWGVSAVHFALPRFGF